MRKLLLSLFALAAASLNAATISYQVSVETGPFFMDGGSIEWILASSGLPPDVTAAVDGIRIIDGSPDPVTAFTLSNAGLFDFAVLAVTYGNRIDFTVTLETGPLPDPLTEGTTFSFALRDLAGDYLINPDGPVFILDLAPGGSFIPTGVDGVTFSQVPEPASIALVGLGLLAFARARVRLGRS